MLSGECAPNFVDEAEADADETLECELSELPVLAAMVGTGEESAFPRSEIEASSRCDIS